MSKEIDSTIRVKWYSTIFLLVGTILAFADPVTDILTLREFYLNDHKTWYEMGLVFVTYPRLIVSCIYLSRLFELDATPIVLISHAIFGGNPLMLALTRFQAFILCFRNFKKLWHGKLGDECNEQIKKLMYDETWFGMFEAILGSAPQFVIQLHATIVQQEQVSTIQIVSLCASFLSLAWTSASADVWRFLTVLSSSPSRFIFITKVVFFISQLFHLSSRLFAITFFIVGFKWWIIAVFVLHSIVMTFVRIWVDLTTDGKGAGCCDSVPHGCANFCLMPVFCLVYWIRDDGTIGITAHENYKSLTKMVFASSILFMIENVIMICVFYAKEEPHAWYSVPVTVYVCVFSLVGFLLRILPLLVEK